MAGFTSPNTTQTPDAIFDYWQTRLTGPEMRVLLYAVRRTFGFKEYRRRLGLPEYEDTISLDQFIHGIRTKDDRVLDEGTGIRTRATVIAAIKKLEQKGLLFKKRHYGAETGDQVSSFALHVVDTPTTSRFHLFSLVNTTQVPDQLFDYWLPRLSDPELFVLLYIIRRTLGFRKASDNIKLDQFLHGITTSDGRVLDEGCGISKKHLYRALKGLQEKGLVAARRRRSPTRGNLSTSYTLLFEGDLPVILATDPRALPPQDDGDGVVFLSGAAPVPDARDVATAAPDPRPARWGFSTDAQGGSAGTPRGYSPDTKGGLARTPSESSMDTQGSAEGALSGVQPGARPLASPMNPQQTDLQGTDTQETDRHDDSLSKVSNDISTRSNIGDDAMRQPTGTGTRLYSSVIAGCIEDWSKEFHDADHFIQNRTQALRRWIASGLDEKQFLALLYEARRRTWKALVQKDATDNKSAFKGAKNRMPYFFKVLQDLIDNGLGVEVDDTADVNTTDRLGHTAHGASYFDDDPY